MLKAFVVSDIPSGPPRRFTQPRSQGLSSYPPGGKMRDPGNEVEFYLLTYLRFGER